MDDEELKKLFESGEDSEKNDSDKKESETPSEDEGVTIVSSDDSESSDNSEASENSDAKDDDKKSDEKSSKESSKDIEKEKAEKEARKRQARLELIHKIEEKENAAALRREQARKKREEAGPLSERVYLDDFPMSYKSILIVLLVISVITLIWSIAFHPFFTVDTVIVNGNYELSDAEIMDELGIDYGSHMLSIFYPRERSLINRNPYVQDISVIRRFPSTIEINVVERKRIAYLSTPDGYISIDDQGTVLEISADYNADVRPLICGIDINSAVLGKKVDVLEDNSFRKMIIVLSAALSAGETYDGARSGNYDYVFFESIKEVRIVSSGIIFITVTLPDGADLQVKLSNVNTISDDMHWLVYAIEENSFENLPDGVLDMTGDSYVYREYEFERYSEES